MPVRIYEIAKELNLESKLVLIKAKELGITAAKVPSSSLDKITAEYLRDQLLPAASAKSAEGTTSGENSTGGAAASAPTPEFTIQFISPPHPAPVAPEPTPITPDSPEPQSFSHEPPAPVHPLPTAQPSEDSASEVSSHQNPVVESKVTASEAAFVPAETASQGPSATPIPPPFSEPSIPVKAVTNPAPDTSEASTPAAPVEPPRREIPTRTPEVAPPVIAGSIPPTAPRPAVSASPSPSPQPTSSVTSNAPSGSGPTTPPPTVPTSPPKPGLGDKVGFINLGNLGRSAGRGDDRRGDNRGPNRPATPAPQAPGNNRPAGNQSAPTGNRPGGGQPYQGNQFGNRGRDQQRRDDRRPGGPGGQNAPRPSQNNPPRPGPPKLDIAANAPTIIMRPPIVVRELADKMGRKPFQVIADLMQMGVFATVTQTIDTEVAAKVSAKNGFRFETEKRDKAAHSVNVPKEQKLELDQEDTVESMKPRPPVITIMGHVDHGKTTLLDRIRKSSVAAGEAGGITQHIGAYTISYPHPISGETTQLTFLDTPGHAAFSAMRARGANVTDIVVLVVAANDGVMPQTIEALSHARTARVPIIVAVNKSDHPAANSMKVRQQLQDKGLVPDDWGGDTLYVDCSGLTGLGVDKLIEAILLQAELMELKANPNRKAKGNIIESGVEAGGPVATVLVRKGTLNIGDVVIAGEFYGKVRAMMNEEGQRLKIATPSMAVRVMGLNGVPEAGSEFSAVDNDKAARDLAEERFLERKKAELEGVRPRRQTLEDIFGQINDLTAKVLKVIVKADTQGSVEAITEALRKIDSNKVQLEIIHSAVGAITESNVLLASSGNAVILGFHSRVDSSAAEAAKREGVQIKLYAIIYELIDQVKEAMAGLLDPLMKEVVIGQAEVRKVFDLSKGGRVAGCAVTSGRIVRGKMRVRRRGNLIYEGVSQTLKRFQDEVPEVRQGLECGLRLEGFDEYTEGDIIECYTVEKVTQKL